ncbi:MAG: hypothetical protein PHH60_05015 [Candidatus Margulisbacteria bacterium]|nr:hypothetical protein [Candidatus Margulisiibacteriota bacterium]
MSLIVAPYKPVVVTSCRTLTLERSRAELLRRELGKERSLYEMWSAATSHYKSMALALAQDLVGGAFDQRRVEETDEAFKVHDPFVFIPLRQEMVLDEAWRDQARLTLIGDLKRLGHRVAVLAPDPEVYEYSDPRQLEKVKAAGAAEKDIVLMAKNSADEPGGALPFPRDLFVQLDDTIYISPGEHNPYDWGKFLQWAQGLKRNYSRIGMGGEVVIGKDFALLSEQFNPDRAFIGAMADHPVLKLMVMTTIGESEYTLQRKGKRVFRIPPGWMELFPRQIVAELGTDKPILIPADHADLQVLHLPVENGLFFSERYYRENEQALAPIVDQLKPDRFGTLPDEDGMPVNSLPLPGGGVYMDAAAKGAIAILRQAGIRVETTSRPYGSWAWGTNGGIHCSTNQVNLLNI